MSDDVTAIIEASVTAILAASHKETRERVRTTLHPGDRRTVRIGDREIGAVRINRSTTGWKVTDRDKFLAWVQNNHPDAVIDIPTIVPAWEREFLKNPVTADGEIPDGVEESTSTPSLVITPNDEAAAVARALLGDALKELEK